MKTLVAIFLSCLIGAAGAGAAAERVLPELILADRDGAPVGAAQIKHAAPWVMLVVDPDKTQTHLTLARLPRKEGDWQGGLVIVALGDQAALNALIARHAGLTGVRWYRDAGGGILASLKLPGVPGVLGIRPNNQIAWQALGLPEQGDRAQSVIATWLRPNPKAAGSNANRSGN